MQVSSVDKNLNFFTGLFAKNSNKTNKVFYNSLSRFNNKGFFSKFLNFEKIKYSYYKVNFFSNRSSLKKNTLIFNKNLNLDFFNKLVKKINTKRHYVLIQMKNDF